MQQWQIFYQLWQRLQQPGLLTTLVRGASTALVVQTVGLAIGYLAQILLARWMGAADYGTYTYIITLSTVLAFLAGLGLSNAVLRFVPEYLVKQDWSHLRGLIWGSWWQTVLMGGSVAAIATLFILGMARSGQATPLSLSLLVGFWLIPLHAVMKLQLELARGIRCLILAYTPSLILYPLVLILAGFLWVQYAGTLSSVMAIALSIGILLLLLTGQFWLFHRQLAPEVHAVAPSYALRRWLVVSLPLLLIDGSFIVLNQTDTLMIGAFLGSQSVGIYEAAFKTAGWVSFILVAVNAIAAPMFASLYVQGDRSGLQRLVSTIAQWMFYPALIMAIGLFVFAVPILHLFGEEFVAAKWAMVMLSLGQLVNVGAGSVGYLLTMTGHQNQCAFVVGCSALMNVLLNLITIPLLGVLGAAIATAVSMAVWNIWLNRLVVKYLGVNPSIVAAVGRGWSRRSE